MFKGILDILINGSWDFLLYFEDSDIICCFAFISMGQSYEQKYTAKTEKKSSEYIIGNEKRTLIAFSPTDQLIFKQYKGNEARHS